MKYQISINQKAIVDNGLNIKGTSLETWALLDFLLFFQNANNLKKIQVDGKEFIWINYKYIIENSPLCNFYNQSIKKHLDLLLNLDLIELHKEKSNDIYFRFTHKIECLFIDKNFTYLGKNLPTPRENFTYPLGKNLPTIIINNKEYINNNNIKEKNIKKRKNVFFVCENFSKIFNSNLFKKVETKKDDFLLANNEKLYAKETKIENESLFSDLDSDLTHVNASKIDLKEKNDKSLIESNKNDLNANYDVLKNISSNKEKKTKKANLKDEALELYHNFEFKYLKFDDWLDWVDYKLEKERKITIHTFKRNIKFLFENDINASKIIDVSISSGWSGLFEIKQVNKANTINYDYMFENPDGSDDFWRHLIENGEYPSNENRKNLEKNIKTLDNLK